jgi:hypothetical protein
VIQQTTWRPDTCSCQLVTEWDDALPDDQRVHSMTSIVHRCEQHAAILDASLFTTVREESRRKNVALGVCQGQGRDPSAIPWEFDAGRTLILHVGGSKTDRTLLQTLIAAEVGLNLVTVL